MDILRDRLAQAEADYLDEGELLAQVADCDPDRATCLLKHLGPLRRLSTRSLAVRS